MRLKALESDTSPVGATLITTFYSFEPFVTAAHAFSPSKIILVTAKGTMPDIGKNIAKVRELYGNVASVEVRQVDGSDLLSIARATVRLLEENPHCIVNVSGGWKLLAQGVLYGCYARSELVERIVCNILERDNALAELPKLSFGLSPAKRELLEEMARKDGRSIAVIAQKLKKTRGMAYAHLRELKELGYVDDAYKLTEAGKMALL